MFVQHLMPTIVYLIILQCKLSVQDMQDSSHVNWVNLDMAKDEWPGISALIGKDPCADNMKYCFDLATIVKHRLNVHALRKNCDPDLNVLFPNKTGGRPVCWIRHKDKYWVKKAFIGSVQLDRVRFEVQYWTDSATVSYMRYAEHPKDSR
uniref:Uncharacterized protein n=1 Tax=Cacopsylla melanoneura TaxID=428564 RepID=A0A8D8V0B1_9HEMI